VHRIRGPAQVFSVKACEKGFFVPSRHRRAFYARTARNRGILASVDGPGA